MAEPGSGLMKGLKQPAILGICFEVEGVVLPVFAPNNENIVFARLSFRSIGTSLSFVAPLRYNASLRILKSSISS